ncbi:right-handed parallel beta-helix repeat-containing protein [Paenibacillus puerhi]|uniref:right-handed parallel beta-helix repeat-containing protein n=1 Tax=Paenibacillus puerhi TaxID=2692622 RepID=UPI001F490B13|nr:NosD domain-containing protein [Paenibacillus puerhi]
MNDLIRWLRLSGWVFLCLWCLWCLWLPAGAAFAQPAPQTASSPGLQKLIDATPEGGTLILQAGRYAGGSTIGKSIRVEARGEVLIQGDGPEPALHIQADNVQLRGVVLEQNAGDETAALLVTGSGTLLEELTVRTVAFGIVLRDNERNEIRQTTVRRLGEGEDPSGANSRMASDKRNGIDLYNSHQNRIHDNDIAGMNDGIYLESSHRNLVENNYVEHSRYGIHLMYTDGTVVRGNRGAYNITGAMVMGVKDAEVTDNTFMKQSESVNSQGLLFFDVETSRIAGNKVEGNRVGLFIEQSHRNEFGNNDVLRNFVGVQFLESEGNRFTGNRFIGNVIESQANESEDNVFTGNYWEAFKGLDTNGDGVSELEYAMNPFFERLTSAVPAFQLFFQSPGMLFLESMFTSGQEQWSVDVAPRMSPAVNAPSGEASRGPAPAGTLAIGLFLLASSIFTTYYLGVRRR